MESYFGLTREEFEELNLSIFKAAPRGMPDWLLETARAERWKLPDPSVYENQADLYRKLSWVLQACQLTGENAAVVKFSVARIISGKEPKDIPNHDFELLLMRPNPLDSRFEFLNGTIISYKLTGNGYWWLNREDENSPPTEIWFIPSHMVVPIPDERLYLRGFLYYPGTGAEIFLEPWQMIHFRRFNPFSRFLGLSAIEAIALVAMGDIGMQKYNTKLFSENNGRLPSVMTFEQMVSDPVWDKIKSDTREASRNREMLMLRGVGQGGVNWLQNAVTQREMEFLEGRKANAKEIMDTIAPGSYTMLFENATEANSRTGRSTFSDLTLYPMLTMMGEKITNGILSSYRSDNARPLIGRFEDVRVTDTQLELQEQERYEKSHVINEIREKYYGDDPIDDERGDLMVAQIKPESGGIQKPPEPPAPKVAPMPTNMPRQEMNAQTQALKADENSAMIALRIPDVIRAELQTKYPFITAEMLNELHITLVYLGDGRTINKAALFMALNSFCMTQSPIRGTLQGIARFVSGTDVDPVVATFDSPQMPYVYSALTGELEMHTVSYHRDHGFIPHATLAYIPANRKLPVQTIDPIEINFQQVYFVDGGQWTPISLTGYANKMASGANSAALEDLGRYERRALRSIGKPFEFVSDKIPAGSMQAIKATLARCTNEAAVKSVFAEHRQKLNAPQPEPKPAPDHSALITLAASLDQMTAAMKSQESTTALIGAVKAMIEGRTATPAPVYIQAPGEQRVYIETPAAVPANVYNEFPIQVESSKPSDVHVDAPVYLTMEAPAPVVTNTTIDNHLPEQPAPVTNVTVENKIPEQAAPSVKNEFIMPALPEQPAPVVNFSVTNEVNPTPITVENNTTVQPAEVKMPKKKKEKQKINRDEKGLIESTDTDIEYEE